MIKNRRSKGFSLIELMVVISIVGILMAMGAVSYTTAQKKARDATRKGDMKALQDAFEQYYADQGGAYPTSCSSLFTSGDYYHGGQPEDPKPGQLYSISCIDASNYCACALLESDTGNSTVNNCTNFAAGSYFCVKNQQ